MKKIFMAVAGVIMTAAMTSCAADRAAFEDEWENGITNGMFFQTEAVTSEYETDKGCAVTYTDPDANMCEVEIYLTSQSYARVIGAVKSGEHFCGRLDSCVVISGVTFYHINTEKE